MVVALLVHELGHALAFRRYGVESSVRFWLFGGVTVPDDLDAAARLSDRQMVVVHLLGPLVGLALGGLVLLAAPALHGADRSIRISAFIWLFVNLGWAAFNLLPIASLDGGRASATWPARSCRGGWAWRSGPAGSLAASALVAVVAVGIRQPLVAAVAVVFGLANPAEYGRLLDALLPGRADRRLLRAAREGEIELAGASRSAGDPGLPFS